MNKAWLTNSMLITIFGISLSVHAQGGVMDRTDRHARDFFESRYENPVIEVLAGSFTRIFPSLIFYSVYDEENLIEDPLIPDLWIRTSLLTYFSGYDMTEALREDDIAPRNDQEAIAIARELLEMQCGGCYALEGPRSFPGGIPARFNDKIFFPMATKTSRGYVVNIHIFYPDSRYAEFYSPYRNNLVEYTVTNNGTEYEIRDAYVYSEEEHAEEARLNEAVITHIKQNSLIDDLGDFLQKRSVYGVTDPPDRSQVQQRIQELSDLWKEGFERNHGKLVSLLVNVLQENPDFRFDSRYLYKKTKDMTNIRVIENYEWRLEVILQEMVERTHCPD